MVFVCLLPTSSSTKRKNRVLNDAVEVRRPRDPGGVSMSLLGGTLRVSEMVAQSKKDPSFIDEETEAWRGEMSCLRWTNE